jgi:hypothetical protein
MLKNYFREMIVDFLLVALLGRIIADFGGKLNVQKIKIFPKISKTGSKSK